MKKILLTCVVLLSLIGLMCDSAHAQLPDDFPELAITRTEDAAPGVLIGNLGKKGGYRVVLDETGYPLLYSKDKNFVYKLVLSHQQKSKS